MAVTVNRSSFRKRGDHVTYDMAIAGEAYKGALVNRDSAGSAKDGTDTASEACLGVSTERQTGGAAIGDTKVKTFIDGVFTFVHSGLTNANIGDGAYVVDNETVDLVGNVTNNVFVGRIVKVLDATTVLVKLFDRADN